uniref:Uncharacterized protein MANES_13G083500 n=1 Tax=Rhizophora mucronata TaxID=61149 RepID=A0A2P2MVK1_RHIMU
MTPSASRTRRGLWCCPLSVPPPSPDNLVTIRKTRHKKMAHSASKPPGPNSVPSSPQSSKSGLNFVVRMDPRRILSPGRVSPIDSDPTAAGSIEEFAPEPDPAQVPGSAPVPKSGTSNSFRACNESHSGDVRLKLRGRKGGSLVLEMSSEVLIASSEVFAGLISEYRKGLGSSNGGNSSNCRIEVPDVQDLGVFKDTIELMFEEDIPKRLLKFGARRAIDILEVSAGIQFAKGVYSCLKYLEAVPWTEEEQDKLRSLLAMHTFDETSTEDILARLYLRSSVDSQQNLAKQLVLAITTCSDANARNELKSLVRGLLCKSSVYEKDQPDLTKEDLYVVCQSCLGSLTSLLEEASDMTTDGEKEKETTGKPLIERISKQVDNINWLLEILLDRQIGEEFVDMWADQGELLKMHRNASPMVRYELSRISAILFIAMGTRKLQCHSEARAGLLQAWFGPMLLDFGWLQRCKKGLDMKALEEAMGQTLLTLPLKQQYMLFMQWFRCFSKRGTECPNLSKAFQIWWRRSFAKGSETYIFESR